MDLCSENILQHEDPESLEMALSNKMVVGLTNGYIRLLQYENSPKASSGVVNAQHPSQKMQQQPQLL